MENFGGKKRPTINLKLFTTFSESFSPTKSPRNFQDGVVGLGIVAAMTDETHTQQPICFSPSPRSTATPVPIVPSVKPHPENSDGLPRKPTYAISRSGNNRNKYRAFTASSSSCSVMGQFKWEFWSDDFLTYCHLCKKELHGLDIFMYRGEKAFCSSECRDKQITCDDDDHKQTCGAEARKGKPLDCSESTPHCSGPQVLFIVVAAA